MSARRIAVLLPVVSAAALLLVAVGCKDKKPIEPQEPQTDLSQSMDIFQQPVPPIMPADPTGAVATVDGQDITAEQFQNEMMAMVSRLRGRVPPEQMAQLQPRLREQTMDQLIAKALLKSAADREKVTSTAEDVEEAKAKLSASLPPGMAIEDILQQRNVSPEKFEAEISEEIRINKLLEKVTASVTEVADDEIKAYYTENQERFAQPELATARHILIATDPQDTDEVKAEKRAKAEKLRARLVDGEDFATVAEAETDDPGSKRTGGLYGPFPRGQMVPQFDEAVFSQAIGEVGPLVETQFGFHIIKVEKREEPRTVPLDEVHTNLAAFLKSRKLQSAAKDYIDGLRSNAQVTVHQVN